MQGALREAWRGTLVPFLSSPAPMVPSRGHLGRGPNPWARDDRLLQRSPHRRMNLSSWVLKNRAFDGAIRAFGPHCRALLTGRLEIGQCCQVARRACGKIHLSGGLPSMRASRHTLALAPFRLHTCLSRLISRPSLKYPETQCLFKSGAKFLKSKSRCHEELHVQMFT